MNHGVWFRCQNLAAWFLFSVIVQLIQFLNCLRLNFHSYVYHAPYFIASMLYRCKPLFLYFDNILRQQFQNHPWVIVNNSHFTVNYLFSQWVERTAWIYPDFSNAYAGVKREPVHALVAIRVVPGVQKNSSFAKSCPQEFITSREQAC